MYTIQEITQDKKSLLPLLLLADPSETMIDRYLPQGQMFSLVLEETIPVCVAVVVQESPDICELKNLATSPAYQNRGFASYLMQDLFQRFRATCSRMLVGTSENGVSFYKRLGFTYAFTRQEFFTKYYSDPIFENGKQCIDMIYLEKDLHARPAVEHNVVR